MASELVLLTGATGMIGFRTLVLLLEAGYRVRAAVRNQAGFDKMLARKPIAPYLPNLESILVPDITVPGAYDQAVRGGVKFIVHVASPLAGNTAGADLKNELVVPAIRGTVGMLESAAKCAQGSVQRIVITASVASLQKMEEADSYPDVFSAYVASKSLSYQATKTFMQERETPTFDVVNIMPSFNLGRDDTASAPSDLFRGTNGLLMGPLVGHALPGPMGGATVHVDDVARLHVQALKTPAAVTGAAKCLDFVADGGNAQRGIEWADSFEIVKKRYPKACAAGVFKVEGEEGEAAKTKTAPGGAGFDTTATREVFGIGFKGFEEQVCSVVDQFLELSGFKTGGAE